MRANSKTRSCLVPLRLLNFGCFKLGKLRSFFKVPNFGQERPYLTPPDPVWSECCEEEQKVVQKNRLENFTSKYVQN